MLFQAYPLEILECFIDRLFAISNIFRHAGGAEPKSGRCHHFRVILIGVEDYPGRCMDTILRRRHRSSAFLSWSVKHEEGHQQQTPCIHSLRVFSKSPLSTDNRHEVGVLSPLTGKPQFDDYDNVILALAYSYLDPFCVIEWPKSFHLLACSAGRSTRLIFKMAVSTSYLAVCSLTPYEYKQPNPAAPEPAMVAKCSAPALLGTRSSDMFPQPSFYRASYAQA